MVPAPRDVYSALVKNTFPNAVKVKAVYSMPNNMADVEVEVSIQPGETAALEQKLVQVDLMTLTASIRSITVDGGSLLEAPFHGVFSPVKNYALEVYAEDGVPKLRPA